MQELNEKEILGTVPKKLQLVETFWDCPEFSRNKQNQKGITLIALIITIIVMLILVGVTVNVALNGGLFSKAEDATTKTKIIQIQEALAMKRGEVLADYKGKAPDDYGITMDKLNLPEELKTEYGNKLIISKDVKLYYDASTVTNTEEQNQFKEMGIQEYVEINTAETYTFTIADLVNRGLLGSGGIILTAPENFWPDTVSEELKNSTIKGIISGVERDTYRISCSDPKYVNAFDLETNEPYTFGIYFFEGNIMFSVIGENSELVNSDNYIKYADLAFTITMAE